MTSPGIASVKQLRLPLAPPEDEARSGLRREDAPVCLPNLLERALERSNMFRALRRVRRNQGAPGVDGMTVERFPGYLRELIMDREIAAARKVVAEARSQTGFNVTRHESEPTSDW